MDTTLPSQPFSSPIYLNAFSISKSHAVWKRGEAENLLAGYLDLGRGYVISMEKFSAHVPQTLVRGKTNGDFANCRLFSQGAFHLSELTGQNIPAVIRISLLIKTIQLHQSNPK